MEYVVKGMYDKIKKADKKKVFGIKFAAKYRQFDFNMSSNKGIDFLKQEEKFE